jgi:hypothetical protein
MIATIKLKDKENGIFFSNNTPQVTLFIRFLHTSKNPVRTHHKENIDIPVRAKHPLKPKLLVLKVLFLI